MSLKGLFSTFAFLLIPASLWAQEHHEHSQEPTEKAQQDHHKHEQKKDDAHTDHSKMNHDPQKHGQMNHQGMAGMQHTHGDMNAAGQYLMRQASGTSMNPLAAPMPMLMPKLGSWHTMIMGTAFVTDTQQSGPRGGDKFYAPNWFMGAVEHSVGKGSFMIQTMWSLDPATVTDRQYPLLFQTGETAFGKPIVDGQHPHDFFMGLGIQYAHPLGEDTFLQVYLAPVGDPALGPVAFPHRASAMELPQATLGHHWQDATHIASDVVTVAIKHKWLRLEASGFHGTEPNEGRWNIDYGPINSWSSRLSVFPTRNWMGQFSIGRLAQPEAHELGDVIRATASLHYSRPMANGNVWSSSLIWGRNHKTFNQSNTNSYTLESVFPVSRRDFLTGRIELVDKDELFPHGHDENEQVDHPAGNVFRVGAYTIGYTHDFNLVSFLQSGLGANFTAYSLPSAIKPFYGDHPFGVTMYARFRLRSGQ